MLFMFITTIFALLCAMWLLAGLIASIFIVCAGFLNKLKSASLSKSLCDGEPRVDARDWPRGSTIYPQPIDYRDVA